MERVRRYINDDVTTATTTATLGTETTITNDRENNDEDETKSFLSSGRIDGRSSDAKSIGSLSQHFFDSDDNEDEKYYGTCNGYTSQPGSKSNLLLCSECDSRSRPCNYRPQTPIQYGKFVEERIDRQDETKSGSAPRNQQQERRASAASSIVKSPMRVDGNSPRHRRDENNDRSERKTKNLAIASTNSPCASPATDRDRTGTDERQCDFDAGNHEAKSPNSLRRSSAPGNSPRCHDVVQRSASRRIELRQEDDADEGRDERNQERCRDFRCSMEIRERSPRHEVDTRMWTRREEEEEEQDDEVFEDRDYHEESEDSPPCPICNAANGNNDFSRCAHCNLSSDQDDPDLICFRCQMSAEEETTSVEGSICQKCENACSMRYGNNGSYQTTSSSSEGTKYPVDAVVKIQVNNRSIDVDSDDTIDSETSNNRASGGESSCDAAATTSGSIDRLETIIESKTDTASENGEESCPKINGQPRTNYLNYMIVLLL